MNILVKAFPIFSDIVQIEPTIEAIYYDNFPCTLTLETLEDYVPFFEHHPLIDKVVTVKSNENDYKKVIDIEKKSEYTSALDTVSMFALHAGVRLLRKTPKIFLKSYPEDKDIVVQSKVPHGIGKSWPIFDKSVFKTFTTTCLEQPTTLNELREQLALLASAALVVGPDSWVTQAAAALDARVVIGLEADRESLRAPFNTIAVQADDSNVYRAVQDVLYEKRYPNYLNQGNAVEFIKNKAKMYMKSNFVDIGCSKWPLPNGIAVDKNNRNLIEKAPDEAFSGIFSSHCLEHIVDWEEEIKLWHRVLRKDGYMFLYLPHPRAEVWKAFTGSWVGSYHVWNPEPISLVNHIKTVLGMEIVEYISRRDSLWSFYIVAKKV